MPGRPVSIDRSHRLALPVAVMLGVIAPAMAQIDPSDKRNVALAGICVSDHDELLVVGAAEPHALVQQDLPADRITLLAQVPVLLRAEAQFVQV